VSQLIQSDRATGRVAIVSAEHATGPASVIERMASDARAHPIGGGATDVMLEEVSKRLARG